MKKQLLTIFFLIACALCQALFAQNDIGVEVIKRDKVTVDSVAYNLNSAYIQKVKIQANPVVSYLDPSNTAGMIDIQVTDDIDSVANRTNKFFPLIMKVGVVTQVGNTARDTIIYAYYPLIAFKEGKAYSNGSFPKAHTTQLIQQAGKATPFKLTETLAQLRARKDSTINSLADASGYRYDTANITLRPYDKHIVFNSTTADTITLLNPSLFAGKNPIVIANIGTGATTLYGGFTVKDKSGSTVSTVGANTVMTLKAYYNGSAYIWLKEY